MMALFGVEEWCQTGEVFSVYFGMFSQLAPFGAKDGRIGRRAADTARRGAIGDLRYGDR